MKLTDVEGRLGGQGISDIRDLNFLLSWPYGGRETVDFVSVPRTSIQGQFTKKDSLTYTVGERSRRDEGVLNPHSNVSGLVTLSSITGIVRFEN